LQYKGTMSLPWLNIVYAEYETPESLYTYLRYQYLRNTNSLGNCADLSSPAIATESEYIYVGQGELSNGYLHTMAK